MVAPQVMDTPEEVLPHMAVVVVVVLRQQGQMVLMIMVGMAEQGHSQL